MPKTGKPAAPKKKHGKSGYIAAIVINVIMLFVFNMLPNWSISFLTADFTKILWAINLSLGATIITNIVYLVYDEGWFRHLSQIILSVIALFVVFLIYSVYPFVFSSADFSHWFRISLIIVMAGIGIAIIVELVKLMRRKD